MVTLNKRPEQLTIQQAADSADWGNAVATCCVQKRGAIPAMPTLDEVKSLMLDR
jgi:fructokinase